MMRFTIIKKHSNDLDNEKEEDKDTQTRQSSGNKFSKPNSFRDMVKNSYQFYLSLGKDKLKSQQQKIADQKDNNLKKLIKRQKIAEQRYQIRQLQKDAIEKKSHQEKKQMKHRKQKAIVKPSRKSQRVRAPLSYVQKSQPFQDQEIFDVLNIESDDNSYNNQIDLIEVQQKSKVESNVKKEAIIQKIQKLKQQLIFQEEGTYEIGIAHEALLRVQKFIDQHINFKHQIRQCRSVQVGNLIKYVKSHGFSTFEESKFSLLMRINPFLYSLVEGPLHTTCLLTFKLNGLQIEKRLESTRRRMTQVSIPELFT